MDIHRHIHSTIIVKRYYILVDSAGKSIRKRDTRELYNYIYTRKKISEYKDKAADITLNQTITLDTNADNYIKDVSPDNWYVCDGWLYKSSFESGYYTLNLDNNSGNFQIEVFTLNQEGQYQCTSERYTDESNSQEEQLLFEMDISL